MLTEQDRQQIEAEKQAFRDWWAGDRGRCFILPRHEGYDVCRVLFPNRLSGLRFHLRYAAMRAIGTLPYSPLKVWLYRRMGVRIGEGVYIAPGVFLDAFYPQLIQIEDGAFLGIGCRILTHEFTASFFRAGRVRLGQGAVIGAWSIVRSGVTIGARATTGLGSVVVSDVPDGATVGGIPARPIRSKGDE